MIQKVQRTRKYQETQGHKSRTHTKDYTNDTRTRNRRKSEVSINPEGSLGIKHRWQNQRKVKNKNLHDQTWIQKTYMKYIKYKLKIVRREHLRRKT